MRISSIEEYGLRCLLALARKGEDSQLTIPEIARLEGLSASYVSKLLSILRKSGLISSVRGRTGGFRISQPAEQINLLKVLTALGGPLIDPDHCAKFSGQRQTCIHVSNCSVHHVLAGLAGYVGNFLSHTTLQSILDNEQMDHVQQIKSMVNIPDPILPMHSTRNLLKTNDRQKVDATNPNRNKERSK